MNGARTSVFGAVLAAAMAAVMGLPVQAAASGWDYVLVVDCSGTMRYQGRAKATMGAIRSFVENMDAGDRVSVYGFGEGAQAALPSCPMVIGQGTPAGAVLDAMQFDFDDDRTDITAGLELAWSERGRVLPSSTERRAGRRGCVIVLTDGKLIPVYDDYSQYASVYEASRQRLLELGRLFGEAGVLVHTIGLGKPDAVDGELLAAVANAAGGDYHQALCARDVGSAFASVASCLAAAPGGPEGEAVPSGSNVGIQLQETAGAAEAGRDDARSASTRGTPNALTRALSAAGREGAYPGMAYQASTAVLGVLMGAVAIGMRRRQAWTAVFTRTLGREPVRVRGYLKPIDPDGLSLARACVPLENPGLESLIVGAGGQFLSELEDTAVEFTGTANNAPPTVRVLKGTVSVDGQIVSDEHALKDGTMIEIGGWKYVYLRGARR